MAAGRNALAVHALAPLRVERLLHRRTLPLDDRIVRDARALRAAGAGALDPIATPAAFYRYVALAHFVSALLPPGARVLDWGGGYGHLTYLLRRLGLDALSYGVEPLAVPRAGTFVDEVPARIGTDRVALPFDGGSFDAVVACGVLEHVDDEAASLAEVRRVLRGGGLFFVFFYPRTWSYVEFLARHVLGVRHHPRRTTRDGLARTLRRAGFQVVCAWERQVLPRNLSIGSDALRDRIGRHVRLLTGLDHLLGATPLRCLATNVECVARKR